MWLPVPKAPLLPACAAADASVVATAPNLAQMVVCRHRNATWGAELATLRPDVAVKLV
jgi:hypothetical protein